MKFCFMYIIFFNWFIWFTFTNISGGYPEGSPIEKFNNFTGHVIWTDKNGPCFFTGTSEVDLASNATFIVNAAIRAGNWTP